jgi:hypothetical protein
VINLNNVCYYLLLTWLPGAASVVFFEAAVVTEIYLYNVCSCQ